MVKDQLDKEREPDTAEEPERERYSHPFQRLLVILGWRRRLLYESDV
jgi:hypothetical protein